MVFQQFRRRRTKKHKNKLFSNNSVIKEAENIRKQMVLTIPLSKKQKTLENQWFSNNSGAEEPTNMRKPMVVDNFRPPECWAHEVPNWWPECVFAYFDRKHSETKCVFQFPSENQAKSMLFYFLERSSIKPLLVYFLRAKTK